MSKRFGLLKKARKYYRQLDYPPAIEILDTDFFKNDAIAHYILGEMYSYGSKRETNLKRDARKAMKHFKRSSELGYREASVEIARSYEVGDGVKESRNQAAKYYLIAIEQGHIVSKYKLADLYIDYFPEKISDAITLLKEIINDGEYEDLACAALGKIYLKGKNVDKDYQKAKAWFEKGVEYEHSSCYMDLSFMYFFGLGVGKDLNKALELVELAGEDHISYEEAKEAIENEMASPRTVH